MKNKDLLPLFNFLQLFRDIPPADVETISQAITFRKVAPGEILLKEGKTAKELFFICSGILKIVSINEKGKPVTLFFLKENRFCTILSSFNNNIASDESIVAAVHSELIIFPRQKLLKLFEQFPYFKELLDDITRQALLNKIQTRNAFMGEDATTRYKKFILQQPDIALRVPLSDIASYLGITQQSLSRIRKNGS